MRKITLFVLTLFTLNYSFGQVHLGLKSGLNLANVENKGFTNAKTRTGFYLGGLLQINLTNKLLLRPELLYSVKGFRTPAAQSSAKSTVSLNYINLPVLVGYRATENLTILAGPELGALASARLKFERNNINESDVYNNLDIGANLGLAYKINKALGVDLRYSYGFSKLVELILTDRGGYELGSRKFGANRVFQVGFYYLIPR